MTIKCNEIRWRCLFISCVDCVSVLILLSMKHCCSYFCCYLSIKGRQLLFFFVIHSYWYMQALYKCTCIIIHVYELTNVELIRFHFVPFATINTNDIITYTIFV